MDNQLKKSYADSTETKHAYFFISKKIKSQLSLATYEMQSETKSNYNDFMDSHYLCKAISILNKNQTELWRASYEKLKLFETQVNILCGCAKKLKIS